MASSPDIKCVFGWLHEKQEINSRKKRIKQTTAFPFTKDCKCVIVEDLKVEAL